MSQAYDDPRRVLLIDEDATKRAIRATVFRNLEIEVHAAPTLAHAVAQWRSTSYDLVLLAAPPESDKASQVAARIREKRPRQRIGLLVGPPAYIQEVAPLEKNRKTARVVPAPAPPHHENVLVQQWQAIVREAVSG